MDADRLRDLEARARNVANHNSSKRTDRPTRGIPPNNQSDRTHCDRVHQRRIRRCPADRAGVRHDPAGRFRHRLTAAQARYRHRSPPEPGNRHPPADGGHTQTTNGNHAPRQYSPRNPIRGDRRPTNRKESPITVAAMADRRPHPPRPRLGRMEKVGKGVKKRYLYGYLLCLDR